MTANEDILDCFVRHIHWLERFKSGEVRRIVSLLNKADRDLVDRIAARLSRISRGDNLSLAETRRLEALLNEIRETKAALGAALFEASRESLEDFSAYEADFKARGIEAVAALELSRPSVSQLRAVVSAKPFQGKLLKEWFEQLTEGQGRAVQSAIRIGIAEGQTTDQIIRRIRGTRALQYGDGILEIGRRQTATVVRTAIAHVANKASEELYAENEDIIDGVQWVSTLDSRTTAVCASRDGKVFPVGKGPRPPAHPNCRSTTIPYLGVSSGARASVFGPVPRSTNYEDWLRRQPAAFQNQALGKGKADLFRKGEKIESFVDPTGKEYTLQQLMQLDR